MPSIRTALSDDRGPDFVSPPRLAVYKRFPDARAESAPSRNARHAVLGPAISLIIGCALLGCAASSDSSTEPDPAPVAGAIRTPADRPAAAPSPPGATQARPREARLYARAGQPLVVPLELAGPGVPVGDRLAVTPTQAVPVRLARLGVTLDEPRSGGDAAESARRGQAWIGRPGTWSARAVGTPTDAAALGVWVAVVAPEALAALAEGRALKNLSPVSDIDAPIVMLADEGAARAGAALLERAAAEAFDADADTSAIEAMLDPLLASPIERWRAESLRRALEGDGPRPPRAAAPGRVRVERPARPGDEIVDALAAQTATRWHIALGRLSSLDQSLALDLARRLMGVIRFNDADPGAAAGGGGVLAPVWPESELALAALLDELLDPGVSGLRRTERARAFLAEQPAAGAWVLDDAGRSEAISGRTLATIAVANLGREPALASVRASAGGPTAPDLRPLAPRRADTLLAALPADPPERQLDPAEAVRRALTGAEVEVRLGARTQRLRALAEPGPAFPPGLRAAPFFPDWTMAAWRRHATEAGAQPSTLPPPTADPAWSTAALVRKTDAGWEVLVECAVVDEPGPGEAVRLWFGAFRQPAAVLLVRPDGTLIDQTAAARRGNPDRPSTSGEAAKPAAVRIARETDRWFAWVPVPAGAIEPTQRLRLAIERTDARGLRTAWPRPMLPWQTEPGRALIDLSAW